MGGCFAELDEWLRNRTERLTAAMSDYIMADGDIDDAQYRMQLGQHQAYMCVRSYLSGARKAAPNTSGENSNA